MRSPKAGYNYQTTLPIKYLFHVECVLAGMSREP